MNSLSERLKSLGVKIKSKETEILTKNDQEGESLIWESETTEYGQVLKIITRYPRGLSYGESSVNFNNNFFQVIKYLTNNLVLQTDQETIYFLDTETTGLAGTGSYPFLVGIGYFEQDAFCLTQFFMKSPSDEKALLSALEKLIHPESWIITFNGKSFDVPLLHNRYTLGKLTDPFLGISQIDLLPLARRLWRNRIKNCSLTNIELEILKSPREVDDIPGWMIPQLYFDYLYSGEAKDIQKIINHNALDILSLAAILYYIVMVFSEFDVEKMNGSSIDLVSIGNIYYRYGEIEKAIFFYEKFIENPEFKNEGFDDKVKIEVLNKIAVLNLKLGYYKQTAIYYQRAFDLGSIVACVNLAKLAEHQFKDYGLAIYWSEKAIEGFHHHQYKQDEIGSESELLHRINRLHKKIKAPTSRDQISPK